MGIVNKRDPDPTWGETANHAASEAGEFAKEAANQVGELAKTGANAATDVAREVWEQSKAEVADIKDQAKVAWDEAKQALDPAEIKKYSTTVVNDVKKEAISSYEDLKKETEQTYDEFKTAVKDGIKQVKEQTNQLKKQAQQSIKDIKKTINNFNGKASAKKISNGFSKFIKEDLADILGIKDNNTGEPLVRQIANSLIDMGKDALWSAFEKNFEAAPAKEPIRWATPTHKMFVEIDGLKLYDKSGCIIHYQEIADFISNDFTLRVLDVEVPYSVVQKVLHAKKVSKGDMNYLYEINLACLPVTYDTFPDVPIETGVFYGLLKTNDAARHIVESTSKTNQNVKENDVEKKFKFTFFLYKEDEIDFQASSLINYMLKDPTPSELILKAFTDANPGFKILMSKIENDNPMGPLLIPHFSFTQVLELINKEVGLYKQGYMTFMESGIFYLLNKDNPENINVNFSKFQTKLWLFIDRHKDGVSYPSFIQKKNPMVFEASVSAKDVKIELQNTSIKTENVVYVGPDGSRYEHNSDMGRTTTVRRKLTNVNPLVQDPNLVMEVISFTLDGFPVRKLTPLSTVHIVDSSGQPRVYRFMYKGIEIHSHQKTTTILKAFRLVSK